MLELQQFPEHDDLRLPGQPTGNVHRGLRRSLVALTAVALLAICVPTAKAQTAADMNSTLDTLFGSHVPLQNFLEALKKAVAADDRPTVAGMIDYPFRARINGKAITIRDATHFVAGYDKIITDPVKQAIAGQSYATLFANWQGVSIGDGEVWFSTVGGASKVKITAITH